MLYTGDRADMCAISLAPLLDIEHPVGFDSAHAFECECIVEWLTKHRSSNPSTGENIPPCTPVASLLRPLIVRENDDVAPTQAILDGAGCTIGHKAVCWKVKLGWDAVFAVLFTAANCFYKHNWTIYAALLVCGVYMTCAHYRGNGRRLALFFVLDFIIGFTLGGWNYLKLSDGAAVIRFLAALVFSVKLSLDVITIKLNAPIY